jgi:hypothetical protein
MQIGNVIIADGKVGIISELRFKALTSLEITDCIGIYLDGTDFYVEFKKCILLDETPNDYINRHVAKFGKLKINSKGKRKGI